MKSNYKSVYDLNNENRKKCIEYLKQNGGKHEFVHYDTEEDDWCDDDGPIDPSDAAPFVIYADDELQEYMVTSIYLDKKNHNALSVTLANAANHKDTMDVPIDYLYGASECYIYLYL